MQIQLSDHFTYKRLLRFVISPIIMMIFMSLYTIVDGYFVSNYVSKNAFAAVNLIMPVIMGVGTLGFMIGTGGNAVISKALGENNKKAANAYFSMFVYVSIILGIFMSIIGYVTMPIVSKWLGASGQLLENTILYGRLIFMAMTGFILQNLFQNFMVTAQKPGLSLKISLLAGITNAILDYLFMAVFHWGIAGAAFATGIGQLIGGLLPLIYFMRPNDSLLRLTPTGFHGKILIQACSNGLSEMVTNLSTSLVSILYNFQLIKIAGENGIAAYGIIMYVNFIFMAIFIGYSMGTAPIISYHFGAGNSSEIKNILTKSLKLIFGFSIVMTLAAELLAGPLVSLFAHNDLELYQLTAHGFKLYAIAFLLMGTNVWTSAFFTALNNGRISASISLLRTFVFQIVSILLLPLFLGINGIWLAVVVSETLAVCVSLTLLNNNKKRYAYA